jgi:neutral ceramidase
MNYLHWKSPTLGCCMLSFCVALSVNHRASAQLRVGAARADITPPPGENGFEKPTGRYEHEHLYVRAIVIDNGHTRAAIIGADQSNMPDAVWKAATERITKELDCPLAQILMSATHTHSPGAMYRPPDPNAPPTPAQQRVVDAMFQSVQEAKGKLQPARMAFGTGMAYLNVNRDAIQPVTHLWTQAPNLLAASDKTVAVLKFETPAGVPVAVYVNYAMHPINGYLSNFVSADFAGAMCRYVEQSYEDKPVVVFSQGASGDQNPLYLRPSTNGMASRSDAPITGNVLVRESVEAPLRDGAVQAKPMDPQVRDRLERWMESEGQILGEEVIRVMTNSTRTEQNVRLWGSQTEVSCPGRKRTDQGREGLTASYVDGPSVPLRLGVLGIGDVALTWVDAEIYTLISQRLKRQTPMANTVMVTLANGAAPSGYIPDDASFSHNTFQVLGSRLKPGCAEDSIANGLTDLIVRYSQLPQ